MTFTIFRVGDNFGYDILDANSKSINHQKFQPCVGHNLPMTEVQANLIGQLVCEKLNQGLSSATKAQVIDLLGGKVFQDIIDAEKQFIKDNPPKKLTIEFK
jgi:hypothetical protein